MKPGYRPDLPKMEQTIEDGGCTPIAERVVLRVRGKAVAQGDGVAIELEGTKTPLTLPVIPAMDDPDTAEHLKERHLGQTVDVEGQWQPGADGKAPGALAVTAINHASGKKHADPGRLSSSRYVGTPGAVAAGRTRFGAIVLRSPGPTTPPRSAHGRGRGEAAKPRPSRQRASPSLAPTRG